MRPNHRKNKNEKTVVKIEEPKLTLAERAIKHAERHPNDKGRAGKMIPGGVHIISRRKMTDELKRREAELEAFYETHTWTGFLNKGWVETGLIIDDALERGKVSEEE